MAYPAAVDPTRDLQNAARVAGLLGRRLPACALVPAVLGFVNPACTETAVQRQTTKPA